MKHKPRKRNFPLGGLVAQPTAQAAFNRAVQSSRLCKPLSTKAASAYPSQAARAFAATRFARPLRGAGLRFDFPKPLAVEFIEQGVLRFQRNGFAPDKQPFHVRRDFQRVAVRHEDIGAFARSQAADKIGNAENFRRAQRHASQRRVMRRPVSAEQADLRGQIPRGIVTLRLKRDFHPRFHQDADGGERRVVRVVILQVIAKTQTVGKRHGVNQRGFSSGPECRRYATLRRLPRGSFSDCCPRRT